MSPQGHPLITHNVIIDPAIASWTSTRQYFHLLQEYIKPITAPVCFFTTHNLNSSSSTHPHRLHNYNLFNTFSIMNAFGNPPAPGFDDSGNYVGQHGNSDWQNQSGQGFQDQGFQGQGGQNFGNQRGYDQGSQGQQGFQGDVQGQEWTAGRGDNYGNTGTPGNTSDANTYGAGGNNFEGAGRQGDQNYQSQGDYDQNNWDNQQTGAAPGGRAGKPSVGQRIKGDLEEVTGKVTRNQGMIQRGQEEKSGW